MKLRWLKSGGVVAVVAGVGLACSAPTVLAVVPPSVNDTQAFASNVSQLTATLNGSVNPHGIPAVYHFAYGASSAYGLAAPVPDGFLAINELDDPVTQTLYGLTPGVTYHFALVATSAGGIVTGPDETFTTLPVPPPLADTGGASGVSLGAATLSGSIDPQGWDTGYYFEYGTSLAYGSRWPTVDVSLGGLAGAQSVLAYVQNLQPGSTYHYRLVADNPGGTSYGTDGTFTTQEYPASVVQEAPVLTAPFGINPETGTGSNASVKHKAKKRARKKGARRAKRRSKGRRG